MGRKAAFITVVACAVATSATAWDFEQAAGEAVQDSAGAAKGALEGFVSTPSRQAAPTLRVLTYNVNGLGGAAAARAARMADIGAELKRSREAGTGPDVVAIQEAWQDADLKALRDAAGYKNSAVGSGRAGARKMMGSGLAILTDFEIEKTATMDFKTAVGWDALANKGALHARLRVPGLSSGVDVYTIHANTSFQPISKATPEQVLEARRAQFVQFAAFVAATRTQGAPVVMAGDFNCKPEGKDYRELMTALSLKSAVEHCVVAKTCAGGPDFKGMLEQSVDHQFWLNGGVALTPISAVQSFSQPVKGRQLSDHWGLEVVYTLTR